MDPAPDHRRELSRWHGAAQGAALGALAGFFARDVGFFGGASAWMWGAAAGALLSSRLRPWIVSLTLVLGAVWTAVAWSPLSAVLVGGLTRSDVLERADAVFVLGSGLQTDGEPTGPALDRLLHGLELLGEGWAPLLIIPELAPPSPEYAPVARRLMARLGLQREIVSVGPVRRTRDEAVLVAALCRQRSWSRILVVTSPTHSRRACGALEREGVQAICSPSFETRFDVQSLDRTADRLPAFVSAVHERLGIAFYKWRGWMAAGG